MKKIGENNLKRYFISSLLILFVFSMMTTSASANTPDQVTGLHNTTYAQTYINWSWVNPHQGYFDHINISIDGGPYINVYSNQSYNLTGLSPNTEHTIHVLVVDVHGDLSSVASNAARTAPIPVSPVLRVHNLNTLENFATIQGAIDDTDTASGHTIIVDSGTYNENVNVNKQLIIRGIDTGSGKPIIDAGGLTDAVNISAGGTTFEGFVATNALNTGIYISSDSNIIRDNNVSDDNSSGIGISNGYYNTIERNVANGNTCGIAMCHSGTNTIRDNDFDSNNAGIFMFNSHDNTLTNNTANGSTIPPVNMRSPPSYVGIHLVRSNGNTINENYANLNSLNGIELNYSSNNILDHNTIDYNVKDGIHLENGSYGNTISDNIANNNNHAGINMIQSSVSNIIERNTANYNTCGISTCHSGTNTIRYNTIDNNNAGIFTLNSGSNIVTDNIADSNIGPIKTSGVIASAQTGIYVLKSSDGTLDNNTVSNNRIGIMLSLSNNSQIKNNTDLSNSERGIYVSNTNGNTIYNNNFNNTQNILLAGSYNNNIWNVAKVLGVNIIGGQYLGGNYWGELDGTGFSDTCDNGNGDGICDSGYRLNGEWDNLPLTNRVTIPPYSPVIYSGNQTNPIGIATNYLIS